MTAKKKSSFVMYKDWLKYFEALPDEQALDLMKAISAFETGHDYEIKDPAVAAYFNALVRPVLIENDEHYNQKVENAKRTNQKKSGKSVTQSDDSVRSASESVTQTDESVTQMPDSVRKRTQKSKSVTQSDDSVRLRTQSGLVDVDVDDDVDVYVDVDEDADEEELRAHARGNSAAAPETHGYVRDVFREFENCGFQINQHSRDELLDMMHTFSPGWIQAAIRRSADRGKKSLGYIRAILESWQSQGAIDDGRPSAAGTGQREMTEYLAMTAEWAEEGDRIDEDGVP